MTIETAFDTLGIKLAAVVAGLAGGVASLAFLSNFTPKQGFTAIIGGAACAAYITPSIALKFDLVGSTENAVAFLLGVGGMNIIGGIFKLTAGFREKPLETVADIKRLKNTDVPEKASDDD